MSLRSHIFRGSILTIALAIAAGCSGAPGEARAPYDAPPAPPVMNPGDAATASPEAGAPAPGGKAPSPAPAPAPGQPAKAPAEGGKPIAPAPEQAKTATTQKTAPQAPAALIVYTGDMAMLVDAEAQAPAMDRIVDIAEGLGGHLAGRTNDSIKVKIPSAKFREGMQKIAAVGEVTSSNVVAEDVTAEYHDLGVRLENLKATRKRLEEFLAKAGNIADMLKVEAELERVAKDMDTISGRLRFLSEHTAFSVLTVHIAARPKPAPPVVAKEATPPTPPAPPPPPRSIDLPVKWFSSIGLDSLFILPSHK